MHISNSDDATDMLSLQLATTARTAYMTAFIDADDWTAAVPV